MSTLKVNKLRDTSGSTDAIVLDPSGGAVLAGVTTISTARITTGITTSIQVGGGVTISESGIEASGIGITCANINGGAIGGRKNLIINGAMQVHQRNVSVTASGTYGIDRWWLAHSGTATLARSTIVPSGEGFDYSLKVSNISGGDASIGQPIELISAGKQGSLVSGKKITFSFYAKCDSGTDGISVICNFRQGKYSATNQVSFTGSGSGVTLTTTWTRHVVTMTIPTCHSGSTMAAFELNGISGTSRFTGFQMEIGDQATPFEHLSYTEEIRLCYRYYYKLYAGTSGFWGSGVWYNSTSFICFIAFPVVMRTNVTAVEQSGTASHYKVIGNATTYTCNGVPTYGGDANNSSQTVGFPVSSGPSQGQSGIARAGSSSAYLAWSAEL